MSLAAEAEIGAVFKDAKEGAVIRATLEELGHSHPPTPLETNNSTATGYSNGIINKKRHKSNGYAIFLNKRQSQARAI
jgi:hypothetical protein